VLEQALAGYEEQRNAVTMPVYQFTLDFVAYEPPPPEMVSLITALHGNQQQTDRFLGILAGTTSLTEFMAPDNIQQIMAGAGRSASPA